MRLLVVSDTHGKCDRVLNVYRKLSAENPVDAIIHCGDHYADSKEIQNATGARVYAVKGNCDGAYEDDGSMIFETGSGSFLITHGHMERVDYDLQRLYYKVLEKGCVGACFGHTHRAAYLNMNGIHLLNPGSLTKPRDGMGGSFGIIETADDLGALRVDGAYDPGEGGDDDFDDYPGADDADAPGTPPGSIICKIYRYDAFMAEPATGDKGEGGGSGGQRRPKVRGGYIRSLLNYSDRF